MQDQSQRIQDVHLNGSCRDDDKDSIDKRDNGEMMVGSVGGVGGDVGDDDDMFVVKRNRERAAFSFDKILRRIKNVGLKAPRVKINFASLVMKVIDQLFNGIETSEIDEIMARECASLVSTHPDYHILASRLIISNHHKMTEPRFSELMRELYMHGIVSPEFYSVVCGENRDIFDEMCDYSRDYSIDYFGFKTLEKSYLLKIRDTTFMERPQHMFMRVAVAIHGDNVAEVLATYTAMSLKQYIHATPTLFNAGTRKQQLSSCFLVAMENDSVDGVYSTLGDCAMISKWSGGIGLHIHDIRATGSFIQGTNGLSNGIVPMLRVFNQTAKYINQGGKRNGSIAVYIEPWHLDIERFLQLRKNHGDEELKARDLFYALWIPDLFMRRVHMDEYWTLMCPNTFRGLADVHGVEFENKYVEYEEQYRLLCIDNHKGNGKTIKARELWYQILDAQMETGTPYLLYKDSCNRKSNQQNLGTIKSSNLCTEIIQYSDPEETAVCNLASVALPAFVVMRHNHNNHNNHNNNNNTHFSTSPPSASYVFDFHGLASVVRMVTTNLNRVIDMNEYPTEKAKRSNFRHRPIGIGIQGLADVFMMMNLPFLSDQARELNRDIFETIYFAALTQSCELAKTQGPYETFQGSPASQGRLQFDLWNEEEKKKRTATNNNNNNNASTLTPLPPSSLAYNWTKLKYDICRHGLRNSLLVAPMPTASTSQILGYTECFEPVTSNIFSRRTLAGEFIVINKYLMHDLIELELWNENLKNDIIIHNGSIQHIQSIPDHMKEKYKTVWELSMRGIIDMSADRGRFICQSQSLNLWIEDPNYAKLTSMHFHSWNKGLKTGIYYLRRRARHQVQKFSVQPTEKFSLSPSPSHPPPPPSVVPSSSSTDRDTEFPTIERIAHCESCSA